MRRIDLFGIIDIIAINKEITAGVQSTSYSGRKPHIDKILASDKTELWISEESNRKLWLITWKKVKKKRGGKAFTYQPHIDVFYKTTSSLSVEVSQLQLESIKSDPV
ncbi:MAG: hypothetical protein BWY21_00343 [Parcubacteria group bacterium ADurb.Bin216]|nr:MAG: hypothetical protein BWY21_00343 [Parcubacteria group bacterium ADurb.Bin216]